MEKNYYEETLEKVKKLIEKKEYKIAYDLLDDELKMPYIPKKYESEFIDLINEVKQEVFGDSMANTVPRDIAIEYLISEDPDQEAASLELLREHNLRNDINVIKRRLETWDISKNLFKAYLFEILVEQEIDIDIDFNGFSLNPKKNGSILENKEVLETMKEIEKLFDKNPSASNVALDEFQRFLLITYPAIPENPKEFAMDIYCVVKSMFENDVDLSEKQARIKKILSNTN